MGVYNGSFSEAYRKSLSVRYVPEAEVDLSFLNVSYRESKPSDIIAQGLQCALCCHFHELIFVP